MTFAKKSSAFHKQVVCSGGKDEACLWLGLIPLTEGFSNRSSRWPQMKNGRPGRRFSNLDSAISPSWPLRQRRDQGTKPDSPRALGDDFAYLSYVSRVSRAADVLAVIGAGGQ